MITSLLNKWGQVHFSHWMLGIITHSGRGKGDKSILGKRVWKGSEFKCKNGPVPFSGFTLFELIIAIALAAVLLALIGTAINLYLTRTDRDRTRVEEAQLARSVLTMIADDIRAATFYQKQDTSAIAALMAAGTPYDTDDFDKARVATVAAGKAGGLNSPGKLTALGGSASGAAASGTGSGSSASGASAGGDQESDDTMPLGLSGETNELWVDATRLPRQEELFATVTGYTNAPSAASSNPGGSGGSTSGADINPPADLKTVHYFVRQGNVVDPGSVAATSLAPDAQASAGGLVREEVGRRMRVFAEQSGTSSGATSGAALIAPEVTQIQFKYYDGTQLTDTWDMKQLKKLPMAIEVAVWIRDTRDGMADPMASSRVYRQVVNLPMAVASAANSAADAPAGGTSSASSDSSGSSSSGTGSAFGNE